MRDNTLARIRQRLRGSLRRPHSAEVTEQLRLWAKDCARQAQARARHLRPRRLARQPR